MLPKSALAGGNPWCLVDPNSDWQDKHWLSSFLSQESYCLLVSFCVLRTLLDKHQVGTPKIWPKYGMHCSSVCGWGPTDCCHLSGELSKSFFLLAVFGSDSGSAETRSFCPLFGDVSCIQAVVQYCQAYLLLSQLKPDNIFERIFFFK